MPAFEYALSKRCGSWRLVSAFHPEHSLSGYLHWGADWTSPARAEMLPFRTLTEGTLPCDNVKRAPLSGRKEFLLHRPPPPRCNGG